MYCNMLSRRCLLTGCISRSVRPAQRVVNKVPQSRELQVKKERFECVASVVSDENESAFCLQTYVKWNDPISKTIREDVQQKWYIVDESPVV